MKNEPVTIGSAEELAEHLAGPLWRAIPADYKARYKVTIWEQFENRLKTSAYTSSFARFLSTIRGAFGLDFPASEAARMAQIAPCQDRAILRLLREETTLIVLLVRAANEERKEKFKASAEGKKRLLAAQSEKQPRKDKP